MHRLAREVHLRHVGSRWGLGTGAADDVREQVAIGFEDGLAVVEPTVSLDGDAAAAFGDVVVIRCRVHHESVPLLAVGASVDRHGEAAIVRSPGEVVHGPGLAGVHQRWRQREDRRCATRQRLNDHVVQDGAVGWPTGTAGPQRLDGVGELGPVGADGGVAPGRDEGGRTTASGDAQDPVKAVGGGLEVHLRVVRRQRDLVTLGA